MHVAVGHDAEMLRSRQRANWENCKIARMASNTTFSSMSFNVVCTVALSIPNILQRATSSVLEIVSLSIELRYCGALDSSIPSLAVSSHHGFFACPLDRSDR
eukprot:scaffold7641_cov115-Cylindrotheca_fusiformis.AAC.35